MKIRFYGNSIYLLGRVRSASMMFWIDKKLYTEEYFVSSSNFREVFFTLEHLHTGWHTLRMLITKGSVEFDAFEIPTDDLNTEYKTENFPEDILRKSGKIKSRKKDSEKTDIANAAVPAAGLAAGAAAAFTIGSILKRKKNKKEE